MPTARDAGCWPPRRPFLRVDGTAGRPRRRSCATSTSRSPPSASGEHEIGHDRSPGSRTASSRVARIDRALGDLEHSRHRSALLSIGVDRLTPVNQALSYAAGDRVLTTIAGRLAGAVGDPDRVARVAGDEFMALLPDVSSSAEAAVAGGAHLPCGARHDHRRGPRHRADRQHRHRRRRPFLDQRGPPPPGEPGHAAGQGRRARPLAVRRSHPRAGGAAPPAHRVRPARGAARAPRRPRGSSRS